MVPQTIESPSSDQSRHKSVISGTKISVLQGAKCIDKLGYACRFICMFSFSYEPENGPRAAPSSGVVSFEMHSSSERNGLEIKGVS